MSAYLDLLMFAVACLVLLMGFPVAFTLAGVALAFGLIGQSLDMFDMGFFYALPQRIFGTMTNEVLIAVPLSCLWAPCWNARGWPKTCLKTCHACLPECAAGWAFRCRLSGRYWPPPPALSGPRL